MYKLFCFSIVVAFTALFSSVPTANAQTINRFLTDNGGKLDSDYFDFDILRKAVATAGLTAALQDRDIDVTLFAPTDLAFVILARDLGYEGIDEQGAWLYIVDVLTDVGGGDPIIPLTQILLYHIGNSGMDIVSVIQAHEITTLEGQFFEVKNFRRFRDKSPSTVDPRIFAPLNFRYSNGYVHAINRVLLPFDPFAE